MKSNFGIHVLAFLMLSLWLGSFCRAEQLPLANFGMKDGMSSDYVTHIVHDRQGFMWISTYYGLNRYDGDRFTSYLKGGAQSITCNNDISCLMSDTIADKIWIAHRWHGLNVFDCRTQTMVQYGVSEQNGRGLSSDEVFGVVRGSEGEVYVVNKVGIDKYVESADGFEQVCDFRKLKLPDDDIRALACGAGGEIFIGYSSSGLAILDSTFSGAEVFTVDSDGATRIPSNSVLALFVDNNAVLWVGTSNGLSTFDLRKGTFFNFSDIPGMYPFMKGNINSIYRSAKGRVWAGTTSDLCYFDIDDIPGIVAGEDTVKHMFIRDFRYGIANPSVNVIAGDMFGNVWVGSNGGGVSLVDDTQKEFGSWRIDKVPGVVNGLNDKEVMTICVDNDGSIWMGTDGGGINVNRGGRNGEVYSSSNGKSSAISYSCSLLDSNGDKWFGAVGIGVIDVYRHDTGRFEQIELLSGEKFVDCIFEDNNRTVWIGTPSGVELFRLDSGERSKMYLKDYAGTDNVKTISQDKRGRIWLGTRNYGIVIYDSAKGVYDVTINNRIGNNTINHIYNDTKGRIWIAMDEGLLLMSDPDSLDTTVFTVADGLACDKICSLTEDAFGNMWMSTNVGISSYNEHERKFYNFDVEDGVLQGSYFPNSTARTLNGDIYFGGLHGVCYFNPKNLSENRILPSVVFTEFKIHGTGLLSTDSIVPVVDSNVRLNYDQNIFSVSFNIMDKSVHGHIEYAYKLAGLSDQWINIGTDNKVTFRNVPYKKYTLYVRARYRQLDWPDEYSAIDIEVVPPLWRRSFMLCLYVVMAVLAVWYVLRSYNRHLKLKNSLELEKVNAQKLMELNEEKLRFYTNITHELRTPLTLILGPIEDLENSGDMGSEQRKKISLIHSNALRLLSLVTKILEFRKTETQNKRLRVSRADIVDCVREAGLKFEALAKNRDVDFSIKLPAETKNIYYDYESISIIIDNLLSNAFKYTERGNITLGVEYVEENGIEYVDITVADTGIGIPKEDIEHIFDRYYRSTDSDDVPGFGIGLALVKNLVQLHDGVLSVESEPNVGSSFRVRLIARNNYPEAEHADSEHEASEPSRRDCQIVLVVDDEKDIRDYIADELRKNYDVILAENGEEGYELAVNRLPDLIITDIMMPGMNGYEMCKKLKDNPATSHIPVMLLSAKDTNQDKIDGYDAGADSYITKPFSTALLRSRVSNILEDRRKMVDTMASNPQIKRKIVNKSMSKIESEFIDRFVEIVIERIEDEKIDVPYIAGKMSLSYSSLYRKVKSMTDLTPIEFIRRLKLHKAEELLLSGKYSISQICIMVGFSSQSYFRECFKGEFGMSPTDYLRSIKGDSAADGE